MATTGTNARTAIGNLLAATRLAALKYDDHQLMTASATALDDYITRAEADAVALADLRSKLAPAAVEEKP